MKAQWKYVVYQDNDGDETIALFGTGVIHADYVARTGLALAALISAGYATSDRECFGASSSLDLKSRPRADTKLARGEGA